MNDIERQNFWNLEWEKEKERCEKKLDVIIEKLTSIDKTITLIEDLNYQN